MTPVENAEKALAACRQDLNNLGRKIEQVVKQIIATTLPATITNLRSELAALMFLKLAMETELSARAEHLDNIVPGFGR